MYEISKKFSVDVANEFPAPGLPSFPLLFSDEHHSVLAYRVAESDKDWQPADSENDFGGNDESYALVKIKSASYKLWTPYSQEGLGKHPLAKVGLRWFSVFEVKCSPLFEEHHVLSRHHFVFQFEDSTLDLVCERADLFRYCGSTDNLTGKMIELLCRESH